MPEDINKEVLSQLKLLKSQIDNISLRIKDLEVHTKIPSLHPDIKEIIEDKAKTPPPSAPGATEPPKVIKGFSKPELYKPTNIVPKDATEIHNWAIKRKPHPTQHPEIEGRKRFPGHHYVYAYWDPSLGWNPKSYEIEANGDWEAIPPGMDIDRMLGTVWKRQQWKLENANSTTRRKAKVQNPG